ncbi:hypothetical protein DTO280E4_5313 [Paecilomyces variotii]|nr:hypothetical protein DTO280E4_5313 [Paecilomyces variotii]
MQQSNWPESQPQSHTEKEKWIKKEVGGTILDPGPASGSGSGDQQALPPQVESLARALVVPYRQNQNQNQGAADLADHSRTYVPLAFAMASNPNANQNQHQYACAGHGQSWIQDMAIGPGSALGYSSGPFASVTNSGAMYPLSSASPPGWGTGSIGMNSCYNNSFGASYAPTANMWSRPMGRTFTLPPTPEPQGYAGSAGFSASGQGAVGSIQRHSSLGASPPAPSASHAYPSGTSVSGRYVAQNQESPIKDENEDVKIPLEVQVQRLHLSPGVARAESSMNVSAPGRAQSDPVASPRASGACPSLGSLDMNTLPSNLIMFYFGVLTTQASLAPRFDFTREDSGKWGVKLTLYGHTLVKEECGTQAAAKLAVCRDAMETLRMQYPSWAVPDEPHETETESLWGWTRLLNKYCEHNKMSPPKYTKYVHVKGFRYEVEVDGASYFGLPKSHRTEREATKAAAHMGFYSTLVRCLQEDAALLCHEPLQETNSGLGTASSLVAAHRAAAKSKRHKTLKIIMPKGKAAAPKVGKKKKSKLNSNLLPVLNRRIHDIPTASNCAKNSRWSLTPSEISDQIRGLKTYREKLERSCNLLNLEYPEVEITQTDGRLIENSEGEYRAAAFFPNDPFLARVGPIGAIKQVVKDKTDALEACSKKVVEYLIHMVEEDTALDRERALEKERVERWKENAISQYVHQGLVDVEEGEVLMQDV